MTAGAAGGQVDAGPVGRIPAVAVLKDGTVVWRGHPKRLDEATLMRWGKAPAASAPAGMPAPGVYAARSPQWAAARDAVLAWCATAQAAECPQVTTEFSQVDREGTNRCNGSLTVRSGAPITATVSTWMCNGGATAELVAQPAGWKVTGVGYDEGGG